MRTAGPDAFSERIEVGRVGYDVVRNLDTLPAWSLVRISLIAEICDSITANFYLDSSSHISMLFCKLVSSLPLGYSVSRITSISEILSF